MGNSFFDDSSAPVGPSPKDVIMKALPLPIGFSSDQVQDLFALAANSFACKTAIRDHLREGRAPHLLDPTASALAVRAESTSNPLSPAEQARYDTSVVWNRLAELVNPNVSPVVPSGATRRRWGLG